jgi:hypothetical protein
MIVKYSAFKLLINVSVFFSSLLACQDAIQNIVISDMLYWKFTASCIYPNFSMAKAAVRQLLTMDDVVQSHGISCVIYGGQSGIDTAFLQVLRFTPVSVNLPALHTLPIYH